MTKYKDGSLIINTQKPAFMLLKAAVAGFTGGFIIYAAVKAFFTQLVVCGFIDWLALHVPRPLVMFIVERNMFALFAACIGVAAVTVLVYLLLKNSSGCLFKFNNKKSLLFINGIDGKVKIPFGRVTELSYTLKYNMMSVIYKDKSNNKRHCEFSINTLSKDEINCIIEIFSSAGIKVVNVEESYENKAK